MVLRPRSPEIPGHRSPGRLPGQHVLVARRPALQQRGRPALRDPGCEGGRRSRGSRGGMQGRRATAGTLHLAPGRKAAITRRSAPERARKSAKAGTPVSHSRPTPPPLAPRPGCRPPAPLGPQQLDSTTADRLGNRSDPPGRLGRENTKCGRVFSEAHHSHRLLQRCPANSALPMPSEARMSTPNVLIARLRPLTTRGLMSFPASRTI